MVYEKNVRDKIRSTTERLISRNSFVIVDSGNFIKGFRYQLYCIARAHKTTNCVILTDVSIDLAFKWNQERNENTRYTEKIFNDLASRLETPNPNQRWDSPLFIAKDSNELNYEEIVNALTNTEAPRRTYSTQSQPLSDTNFLHEMDRITQEIINAILEAQSTAIAGDTVTVPSATVK